MKKYIKLIAIIASLLTSCTSGQNSPADSHPGSGSVKAGSNDNTVEQKDTTQVDSTRTDSKKSQ
ncbi:hypothetical protein [Pedobacter terrae]|uniref:hypothetical protein n=1 Tax=Pedobacter terrae TaxID=405671 RepID=UPI002FFC6E37